MSTTFYRFYKYRLSIKTNISHYLMCHNQTLSSKMISHYQRCIFTIFLPTRCILTKLFSNIQPHLSTSGSFLIFPLSVAESRHILGKYNLHKKIQLSMRSKKTVQKSRNFVFFFAFLIVRFLPALTRMTRTSPSLFTRRAVSLLDLKCLRAESSSRSQ